LAYNTSKRSVILDLDTASGRRLLQRLVGSADVFVTDRTPADLFALGLNPDDLRDRYPQLVIAAVTPFGLVGGAAASRALLDEAWAAGLPIATTWGMTETASQVATAPPGLARLHPGTAGRPLRGLEIRTPPGGVLQVRGPTLATVAVAGPGASPQALPRDGAGWFTTRDLGRVDSGGLVWIKGRADAMIMSGGLNVSPGEVERLIETLPGVREAVVFGMPDEEWGEVVAAVVEADPAEVRAADIDRHCREQLARGRCPSLVAVVDSLPRTWTGKVMRTRVRDHFGPVLGARKTT